jgi:hypothetical protein
LPPRRSLIRRWSSIGRPNPSTTKAISSGSRDGLDRRHDARCKRRWGSGMLIFRSAARPMLFARVFRHGGARREGCRFGTKRVPRCWPAATTVGPQSFAGPRLPAPSRFSLLASRRSPLAARLSPLAARRSPLASP